VIPRLSLTLRIGLIVVLSVTLVWISSVALFYLSLSRRGISAHPLPVQIAALVELVEETPRAERALLLRALQTSQMSVKVENGLQVDMAPGAQRVPRLAARSVTEYLKALGGRPVSVTLPEAEKGMKGVSLLTTPVDLEFRIGLKSHETLVIDATHPPLTNVLGLPLGFVAGLSGTFIGLAALLIMQRETKPLTRLAAAVDEMNLSEASIGLPENGSEAPEIRGLLAAFNRLHARLVQLLRGRLALIAGISHDVRTFATRLRLRVEKIADADERAQSIADIEDMVRLLDDSLIASRAGAGELDEELVEFDPVVRAEVESRRAENRAVDLEVHADGGEAVVLGDRLALRRVVANLVDNALKYGAAAHVGLEVQEGVIVLTVDDEGPGIPLDRRETIMEPFVRLESSRNRSSGGAGLGLSVARNLIEAHRGSIDISTAPSGGARLTVRIPAFSPRSMDFGENESV
jgi:signal transduction histidine kinase